MRKAMTGPIPDSISPREKTVRCKVFADESAESHPRASVFKRRTQYCVTGTKAAALRGRKLGGTTEAFSLRPL